MCCQKIPSKWNEHGIYRNRYWSSLEGNQCKKYRKRWEQICNHICISIYKPIMKDLNRLVQILSQSKPLLTREERVELPKWLAKNSFDDPKPTMPWIMEFSFIVYGICHWDIHQRMVWNKSSDIWYTEETMFESKRKKESGAYDGGNVFDYGPKYYDKYTIQKRHR